MGFHMEKDEPAGSVFQQMLLEEAARMSEGLTAANDNPRGHPPSAKTLETCACDCMPFAATRKPSISAKTQRPETCHADFRRFAMRISG
jgi:hypothetical protein